MSEPGKRGLFGLAVLGGTVFWLPTVVVELATKGELNPLVGTVLGPVSLLLTFLGLRTPPRRRMRAAVWMLVGLYVAGPFFMSVGAMPRGGGFSIWLGWGELRFLLLTSLIPFWTIVLSGYDGTLFGVLLVSGLLPLVAARIARQGNEIE